MLFSSVYNKLHSIWLWIFDRFILYPIMFHIAPRMGVTFMNLGYWPKTNKDIKMISFLNSIKEFTENENGQPHIYLYEKTLSMHSTYPYFHDCDILEVSCGQANALDWIETWHGPLRNITGCDKVVCRKSDNIKFGDAMNLPFDNDSFDLVINVEASHLYSNCQQFFKESYRVIRPGGVLCWADIRYPYEVSTVQHQALSEGFELEYWEDITENVLLGLEKTSKRYDALLEKSPFFVKWFSNTLRTTYCAPGTYTYDRLAKREKTYIVAMWKKI